MVQISHRHSLMNICVKIGLLRGYSKLAVRVSDSHASNSSSYHKYSWGPRVVPSPGERAAQPQPSGALGQDKQVSAMLPEPFSSAGP